MINNTEMSDNEVYFLCPLYSFVCDSQLFQIDENVEIIQAPIELKRIITQELSQRSGVDHFDPMKFQWALKIDQANNNLNSALTSTFDQFHSLFHILVWSFRLNKEGYITPGPVHLFTKNNSEIRKYMTYNSTICKNGYEKKPTYQLTNNDIIHIKQTFTSLKPLIPNIFSSQLKIALDRFDSSYCENNEDALVDQMIAFETLFLGDNQELNYKLGMRIAFFLQDTEIERKTVFNNIRKAYNLRSDIVHGKNKVNHVELENILPLVENYLRRSIKKYLYLFSKGYSLDDLKQGKKETLAKLDENIISNGKTLECNNY
jgi:hypothetical protein